MGVLDSLALPSGVVLTDPEIIETYRFDRAADPAAGTPLAVARVTDAAQVQECVRWAAATRVPVVPRGAGTGLSGGASAVDGCLVLSLERMRAVTIDTASRIAIAEPGALNVEVKRAATAHGLWYPPDPSSQEICSIGGNIATNAGGLCCVKYGVTTDYVLGLDVVLADGRLVTLGGNTIKDTAGLSLTKLFVGSEGTLGVVTRAILRLVPQQPPPATLVATFRSVAAAARAVVAMGRRLRPAMVELMDRASVNAVEDFRPMGLDRDAGALLIVQSDAPGRARRDEIEQIQTVVEAHAATEVFATDDPDESAMFVTARRLTIDAVQARGMLMLDDVGVPVPRLPELFAAVETTADTYDLEIAVVAHAGDGNTHPLIVYGPESAERAQAAFEQIMLDAVDLGGTITGEHGVGRTKRGVLPAQLGPDVLEITRRIKAALDPHGILNPGAILPSPTGVSEANGSRR